MDARQAAELAARSSYARLVAFVAARTRDVPAAEDALSDAFVRALEIWPREGIPACPEAWLLTTARRGSIDSARHGRVEARAEVLLRAALGEASTLTGEERSPFPDDRLKLLFACAHPAIDAGARTPLMLQVVLGLDASRIASAFLVQPSAMGQRLTRAKVKIRDAGIPFQVPSADALPARLDAVLSAIYAAFGSAWDDVAGADARRRGLSAEAIELGRLVAQMLPGDPEALGLLALMLHCEARRAARRDEAGGYVQLSDQDVGRWSRAMIEEAEQRLASAAGRGRPGRFQLEAAIQSVHAARARTGRTDWSALALLYEGLVRLAPSVGAMVGRAAAVAVAQGAEAGWALLEGIPRGAVTQYQAYWALAAHLLARLGRVDEARLAYQRAIGLSADPAIRDFLGQQLARLCRTKSRCLPLALTSGEGASASRGDHDAIRGAARDAATRGD